MGSHQKHYLKVNPYLDIISGIAVVLSFSDGLIKIIGREGSGKSVLTQLLAAELIEEDQEVVIFSDIPHSEQELHDPISQQLHLNLGANSDFFEALNRHIQARPFDQQKLILVFDDADQIPEDCFAAIRHLFEQNYHDRPEVSMVFAGSELLDEKLNEPDNRTFNKNIILNFEVKPMNRSELEAFCNAYLVEMGLQQNHRLSNEDLDDIYKETQGLPGKIPELIFSIIDREQEEKKAAKAEPEEKKKIKKLVVVDDDPEPELTGLSVEDREEVLTAFKDQVPWRWQSNGVGMAVVVLFLVVAYGYFVPEDERLGSIVIFPPPTNFPGQLSAQERASLADTLAQQSLGLLSEPVAVETPDPVSAEPGPGESVIDEAQTIAEAEAPETGTEVTTTEPEVVAAVDPEPEETVEPGLDNDIDNDVDNDINNVAQAEPVIEEEAVVTPEPEQVVVQAPPVETPVDDPLPAQPEPAPEPVIEEAEQVAVVPEPAEPEPVVTEPAPQVTQTPRLTPVSTTPALPTDESREFVDNWLQAWENKNIANYLDAYSEDFVPAGGMTTAAWENDRRFKINRPSSIEISQEGFEVLASQGDETRVRVQFSYSTPSYADRTVKELVLVAENGSWAISSERNISVNTLSAASTEPTPVTVSTMAPASGESGFDARIRQVLAMVSQPSAQQLNSPVGMFINEWLGAWKSQDVESYFRHYADEFSPAQFDSMTDWRADRIRKINEKRFIDIAFDDIEVLDEAAGSARVRFWLSYASSFYLDRTLKEVVISTGSSNPAILQERNLEVEIIPFYP